MMNVGSDSVANVSVVVILSDSRSARSAPHIANGMATTTAISWL